MHLGVIGYSILLALKPRSFSYLSASNVCTTFNINKGPIFIISLFCKKGGGGWFFLTGGAPPKTKKIVYFTLLFFGLRALHVLIGFKTGSNYRDHSREIRSILFITRLCSLITKNLPFVLHPLAPLDMASTSSLTNTHRLAMIT